MIFNKEYTYFFDFSKKPEKKIALKNYIVQKARQ